MGKNFLEIPIPEPKKKYQATGQDADFGRRIDPVQQLAFLSPDEFESFIELWISHFLNSKYQKVVRCGGAGDLGRDIIAYYPNNENEHAQWDNYQCKHYKNPLTPSDIWIELGKCCYYAYKGKFLLPNKYYFTSSKGIGTSLVNLFEEPNQLKYGLIENWDKKCREKITKKEDIDLTDEFRKYIEELDFGIFTYKTPLELVDEVENSIAFSLFFGGGLRKRREVSLTPPKDIQTNEKKYVEKLFCAYGDSEQTVISQENLETFPKLKNHFNRQRIYYYVAETLLDLERDTRTDGEHFVSAVKDEVLNNIIDTLESSFENGFERVKAVTDRARLINFDAHPLKGVVSPNDSHGICHHLVNDDLISWVDEDDE
ncbi:restriction endonuclease [Listeria booriae]|uniref:ABC-three component system protein n=1 Tax=Listeria booriae TaxID=1552123 RepID=UPI001623BEA7|nr:ABC-three component system protein [Listeria booriae]MBC2077871.1 restriction endonuclease [Listeria booriae]